MNDFLLQKTVALSGTTNTTLDPEFVNLSTWKPQSQQLSQMIINVLASLVELKGLPKLHFVPKRIGNLYHTLCFDQFTEEKPPSPRYAMLKQRPHHWRRPHSPSGI